MHDSPTDLLSVSTTTATRAQARQIAHMLVQNRLAACVQVTGPIESTYWWQGEIQQSEEWLCVAKTNAGRLDTVERAIHEVHSYDVPEIITTPITGGSTLYLKWLVDELAQQEDAKHE